MATNLKRTYSFGSISALAVLAMGTSAWAQDEGTERNMLFPHYSVDGNVGVATDDAGIRGDTGPAGSLQGTYIVSDLPTNGDEWTDTIRTDLLAGFQVDRVRAGVDVPFYPEFPEVNSGSSIGNVALDLRGTIMDRKSSPLGVGVSARGWLGAPDSSPIASDGGFEASIAIDDQYDTIRTAYNAGWREVDYDPSTGDSFGDSFFGRGAILGELSDRVAIGGELEGELRHDLAQLPDSDSFWAAQATVQTFVGLSDELRLQIRAGTGFRDTAGVDDLVQPFGGVGLAWMASHREEAKAHGLTKR